jgi:ribosomal protein L11 methyltransferase
VTALVRLGIRVRGDRADTALAQLLPLAPAGAEERAVDGDVEYALYGPADELPRRTDLQARLGDALIELRREAVAAGWERRWHEFLRPVTVRSGARELTVRPPWLDGDPADLVIDPGLAFGAGAHATTRLSLQLLLREPEPGGALCDWGAGSGILAVAAARLGWRPVTAVELDSASLPLIRANAAANGVTVTPLGLDLADGPAPWAPTVCANLTLELLLALPARIERPPGRMLVAGVLGEQADAVAAAFAPLGLREARRLTEEGWAALRLVAA